MRIVDPLGMKAELNQIAGVVSNGIFVRRPAGLLLPGSADGVRTIGPD
jgi:ribose 5-phosphate isomerase A